MTDRRTFHTSALAAPTSAKAHWDMMMQRLVDAERAYNQFNDRHRPILDAAYRRFPIEKGPVSRQPGYSEWDGRAEYERVGDESDGATNAYVDADYAMLMVEAPDTQALLWKIEKAFSADGELAPKYVTVLMKDARRLLASPNHLEGGA